MIQTIKIIHIQVKKVYLIVKELQLSLSKNTSYKDKQFKTNLNKQ